MTQGRQIETSILEFVRELQLRLQGFEGLTFEFGIRNSELGIPAQPLTDNRSSSAEGGWSDVRRRCLAPACPDGPRAWHPLRNAARKRPPCGGGAWHPAMMLSSTSWRRAWHPHGKDALKVGLQRTSLRASTHLRQPGGGCPILGFWPSAPPGQACAAEVPKCVHGTSSTFNGRVKTCTRPYTLSAVGGRFRRSLWR